MKSASLSEGRRGPAQIWNTAPQLAQIAPISATSLVPAGARVVVIAPHPGDEVLACGGMLQLLSTLEYPLQLISITDGSASHPGSHRWPASRLSVVRPQESAEALRRLGMPMHSLKWIRGGFCDNALSAREPQLSQFIARYLQAGDVVFTTWRNDGNPDHEAVGRASAKALLGQFGLGLTVPGEAWHIGWLGAKGGPTVPGGPGDGTAGIDPIAGFISEMHAKIGGWKKSLEAMGPLGSMMGGVATSGVNAITSWAGKLADALENTGVSNAGFQLGVQARKGLEGMATKAQVKAIAATRGWGSGAQWNALSWIIQHESGWDPTVKNRSGSSAFGLFQFLTSTQRRYGYGTSAAAQAQGGMNYIADRYGTPLAAKAFWERNRWYDSGGVLQPGMTVAMNGTGKPEAILTDPQWQTFMRLADHVDRQQTTAADGAIAISIEKHMHRDEDDIAKAVTDAIEEARRRRRYMPV